MSDRIRLIEFGKTLTNEVRLDPMMSSVMDRVSQTLLVGRLGMVHAWPQRPAARALDRRSCCRITGEAHLRSAGRTSLAAQTGSGEPAAGCNAVETEEIDRLIREVAGKGIAVVLVEHDMKLVMKISDRILVLDRGKTLVEGTPSEVRNNPAVLEAYLGKRGAREAARA